MMLNYSLNEDFILLEKIGLGNIHKVQERETGNFYSAKCFDIKDLQFKKFSSLETLNHFFHELDILHRIKHKSIIELKYFSEKGFNNDKQPVLIMEYMENGSLSTLLSQIRNNVQISAWNSTKKLINIYGIACAISYLHLHNITHRDLNIDNILLDNFLYPKVIGLGLSKIIQTEELIESKDTARYIAPELIEDYKYTPKCDVYSYGIIVYEIMTNLIPYEDKNLFQIFQFSMKCIRPPLTDDIPPSYRNLIERCWAQEPQERPTFDEIINLLKNDREFITPEIDEEEFRNYVDSIDNQQNIVKSKHGNFIDFNSLYKGLAQTVPEINENNFNKSDQYLSEQRQTKEGLSNVPKEPKEKSNEKGCSETKLMQEIEFVCPTCLEVIESEDFLMHSGFAYHKGCLKCHFCQKIIETNDDFMNFEFLKPGFFVCKNEFDEYCEKFIENSIKEIFDPTVSIIIDNEDFINSDMIKHSYRLNKNYKYFVPTVTFHYDFSPENINFEKLFEALPEEMIIVDIEPGSTFLTIAFMLTEEFQNSNEKCQQIVENFTSKLANLTSLNDPIVGNLKEKPILNFPDEKSFEEFLSKKSVNIFQNPKIIKRISSKKIKKYINRILQLQKENCKNKDWEFIIKNFHLYSSAERKINQHMKKNEIEFIAVGMTLIPNKFYNNYKNIKKSIKGSIEKQILYHGTSFSNQRGIIENNFTDPKEQVNRRDEGYFGIGIYATDNIFYASMFCSYNEQVLNMNDKATILCCKSIYNINYMNQIDENNVGDFCGNPFSTEVKSNYGAHIAFVESKNHFKVEIKNKNEKIESIIQAYEYVFPNSHQIIPICSLTIMRTDFFILWIDGTNNKLNSSKIEELKSIVEENVYYVNSIDESKKIVETKKRNKMKVILSFDNGQMIKDSINLIREIIGENFVCLIYSNDFKQKEITANMENVLFTNNFDDLIKFAQIDLRLECIIPFITEIKDKYNLELKINTKSLVKFNLKKYI